MNAGELRHRLTLQANRPVQDSFGAETETWVTLATVWAGISALKGHEMFTAQQTVAEVTHKVRMRYRAGVEPAMRLLFGARKFDINWVNNIDERNVELELLCTEVLEAAS